ncbi:MAG: helix-turn-helix transcriptional regulator [Deltaproteobacteria bacterium]|nr:helix-turn-helix transcriptional regulator [Deltaproteobacteria bacterium]
MTYFLIVFFTLISILTGLDVWIDFQKGGTSLHLYSEILVVFLAMLGALFLIRQSYLLKKETQQLQSHLQLSRKEAIQWKQEAQGFLKGLGEALDQQFLRWGFTPAEKEIALLLLKGLSHKEIATIRQTSEKTVRQQSGEIYRKSKVTGRTEFSAFFLEDLLLPYSEKTTEEKKI